MVWILFAFLLGVGIVSGALGFYWALRGLERHYAQREPEPAPESIVRSYWHDYQPLRCPNDAPGQPPGAT